MGLRCVRSGPTATTPKPTLGECWKGFKSFFREPRVSVYEKVVTWGTHLALAPLAACLMMSFLAPVCAMVSLQCYHVHLSLYHHQGWDNRTLSSCTGSICNRKLSKSPFFIKLCIFKSSISVERQTTWPFPPLISGTLIQWLPQRVLIRGSGLGE